MMRMRVIRLFGLADADQSTKIAYEMNKNRE